MNRRIVGFHEDKEHHWVAELDCGHDQHVRHNPPWSNRPWVVTPEGRKSALGNVLNCKKCELGAPKDRKALKHSRTVLKAQTRRTTMSDTAKPIGLVMERTARDGASLLPITDAERQARIRLAACYRVFDHLAWTESIWSAGRTGLP
jgi:hypothetical protein